MDRKAFADRISASLSGWFQQLAAQEIHLEVGEDAVRVELVRTIGAQNAFSPKTSQRPLNWPKNDKRRVDIAILGRSNGSRGWYGVIEVKWPGTSNDVECLRRDIVQDAIRAAFSETGNLNARFLVLGGSAAALGRIFDKPHRTSKRAEAQRLAFCELFSRDRTACEGFLSHSSLQKNFPSAFDRIDASVTAGWTRRLATQLLSVSEAKVGEDVKGRVLVWQCRK